MKAVNVHDPIEKEPCDETLAALDELEQPSTQQVSCGGTCVVLASVPDPSRCGGWLYCSCSSAQAVTVSGLHRRCLPILIADGP